MYSTVSKVATLLTTQFMAIDYWMVGLSLFQAAASVITQLDELMHMRACIDLSHKFLGSDRERKEVLAAAATLSGSASSNPSSAAADEIETRFEQSPSQLQSQSPSQLKSQAQEQSALSNLLAESMMEAEAAEEQRQRQQVSSAEPESLFPDHDDDSDDPEPPGDLLLLPPPSEDPDLQLARAMTMEELSHEIQAILRRVNLSFTGRSQALAEEFLGLQEAIQATLQVPNLCNPYQMQSTSS